MSGRAVLELHAVAPAGAASSCVGSFELIGTPGTVPPLPQGVASSSG